MRGDQGPSRSKTCTVSSKAYDPSCYFHPYLVKKTDISYFQRNVWREASHLSSSTLQSQTRLLCYFQPPNHWFAPLLLSPRLPHTRVDMQRFAFLCPKHVFPLWFIARSGCSGQTCAPARSCICTSGSATHRGRVGEAWEEPAAHTRASQLFLVDWNNPMSSLRNCSGYRIYTGMKSIEHLQILSPTGPLLGPPGVEPTSYQRETSSPRNLSFPPVFSPPTCLI